MLHVSAETPPLEMRALGANKFCRIGMRVVVTQVLLGSVSESVYVPTTVLVGAVVLAFTTSVFVG